MFCEFVLRYNGVTVSLVVQKHAKSMISNEKDALLSRCNSLRRVGHTRTLIERIETTIAFISFIFQKDNVNTAGSTMNMGYSMDEMHSYGVFGLERSALYHR